MRELQDRQASACGEMERGRLGGVRWSAGDARGRYSVETRRILGMCLH